MLRQFGIRPSKRWGQHFLISLHALERTLDAAALAAEDSVLEVGAGLGTLTLGLSERAGWVTAVEVDRRLLAALAATAGARANVRIVPGDILTLSPAGLFGGPAGAPRKVVANLPYNIATAVISRLLAEPLGLTLLVVTVQREVAERIVAAPGTPSYGILSLAVQYRAYAQIAGRIPPGSFLPAPEVASAIVRLTPLREPQVVGVDERTLFRVIRAGFGQRRKMLQAALTGGLGLPKPTVVRSLTLAGIDPRARAETVDLAAFGRLAHHLGHHIAQP
jgi:16S rRNA (adenine1518-N6/adenine1519-N6)-dimethyltransferase